MTDQKITPEPNERPLATCTRLVAAAPSFAILRMVRVEAAPGESVETVYARWWTVYERRRRGIDRGTGS